MGDTPTEDDPDRGDETAKLELTSLSLPRFGRRKKRPDPEPAIEGPAGSSPEPESADSPDAPDDTDVVPAAVAAMEEPGDPAVDLPVDSSEATRCRTTPTRRRPTSRHPTSPQRR